MFCSRLGAAGVPIPGPPMGGGGPAAGTTVGDAVAPLSYSSEVMPRSGWSSVSPLGVVPPAEVKVAAAAAAVVEAVTIVEDDDDDDDVDGGKRGRSVVTSLLLTVVVVLSWSVSSSPAGDEGEWM